MRQAFLAAAFTMSTALAAPVAAARAGGQHDGSWQSDRMGTFWSDGKLPVVFSLRITLRFEGGRLIYHSVNDTDPAKPTTLDYVAPLDGSVIPIAGQDRYNQVSVRQLSADEFQLLKMKDGDVIVGEFWVFRADRRTLVRRGVGKAPDGVSKAFQETFRKVALR